MDPFSVFNWNVNAFPPVQIDRGFVVVEPGLWMLVMCVDCLELGQRFSDEEVLFQVQMYGMLMKVQVRVLKVSVIVNLGNVVPDVICFDSSANL